MKKNVITDFSSLDDSARLKVRELAALFGVDVRTIWRWTSDGRLPEPHRISPRVTRWTAGDVRRSPAFNAGRV